MIYSYRGLPLAHSRDQLVLDLCGGKRVLHIGAADSPFTEEKLASGNLLHARLGERASELLGIDTDEEAVRFLRGCGFDDLEVSSIETWRAHTFRPEYLVFGETIEHLSDPGTALRAIARQMDDDSRLILTTPNLCSLFAAWQPLRQREVQHSDHRIGLTYGLLQQLLTANGLRVTAFWFTFLDRPREDLKRRFWRLVARFRPGLAETLVAVCRPIR